MAVRTGRAVWKCFSIGGKKTRTIRWSKYFRDTDAETMEICDMTTSHIRHITKALRTTQIFCSPYSETFTVYMYTDIKSVFGAEYGGCYAVLIAKHNLVFVVN